MPASIQPCATPARLWISSVRPSRRSFLTRWHRRALDDCLLTARVSWVGYAGCKGGGRALSRAKEAAQYPLREGAVIRADFGDLQVTLEIDRLLLPVTVRSRPSAVVDRFGELREHYGRRGARVQRAEITPVEPDWVMPAKGAKWTTIKQRSRLPTTWADPTHPPCWGCGSASSIRSSARSASITSLTLDAGQVAIPPRCRTISARRSWGWTDRRRCCRRRGVSRTPACASCGDRGRPCRSATTRSIWCSYRWSFTTSMILRA